MYYWIDAEWLRNFKGNTMPYFQELQRDHPNALVQKPVKFSDVMSGRLVKEGYSSVSHRWMEADRPDRDGTQLQEVQEWLRENKDIKYTWFDDWCMPQGARSDGAGRLTAKP